MDKTPKKKLLLRPQEAAKTLSTSTTPRDAAQEERMSVAGRKRVVRKC